MPCSAGRPNGSSPSRPPPRSPGCCSPRPWPGCSPRPGSSCPGRSRQPAPSPWARQGSPSRRWQPGRRPPPAAAHARHALAAFLDLVVISIAAGAGVEAALTYAGATGRGWAFTQIRGALETARLTRRPPWEALGQLGHELGISELTELAASITLAGTEGAKVKASLGAKAAAIRARQLSDAETTAQAATERMSLPLVLLFAGFLLLIGFPAVVHVLTGI